MSKGTKIRDHIVSALVAFYVLIAADYSWVRWLSPITWHFEYRSVSLIGEARVGRPLEFRSSFYVAKDAKAVWDDVLICRFPGTTDFVKYSSQPFSVTFDTKVTPKEIRKPWKYRGTPSEVGSVCYLDFGPQIHLRYGIIRQYPREQTFTFTFVE